ncbi:putative HNHc nuclease [Leuconostoc mesenteroides]|uniref:putative HNHc nuclease n=1 Tax=Leuconostoc mesenteroides TaxID=1245 RepID=UPI0010648952|nr:putative HNHc nuclease [Leuconostoc mesenteroides]TDV88486.1 putative HNHc nuclease [Leuconostoc mesenteroides]
MTELFGQVNKLDPNKGLVTLRMSDDDLRTLQKYHATNQQQVLSVIASDDNEPTPKQRRFAFALLNDVWLSQVGGAWLETVESTRRHFYGMYEYYHGLDFGEFSLSAVKGNKSDTNEFINMLLDYAALHDIALSVKPLNELEPQEIAHWEYQCLMNKCCVICGKRPSDLHHLDGSRVGIGSDRKNVNHLGRKAVQLCREHHQMFHSDENKFMKKFHINGIAINDEIARVHRLNTK